MIYFNNIIKKYDNKIIINKLNLHINKGKLTVLIGPSGCGKTTLLRLINKLIKPTSGTILVNGKDISNQDTVSLRRNMGYVIQQTGLFPHMTIRENIEIIPKLEKYEAEKIAKRTIELMEMVGLQPDLYLDRYPVQLSGGQKQRIGVARAFACDPDIILMDEPFSALDPVTKTQLQDELVEIQSTLNKTIVFVTHDMDEAIKVGDYICLLNGGDIVQYDTPEEILKHPANDFAIEFIGKNRIWSAPELIRAEDIMLTNPICASSTMTAFRALDRLKEKRVDMLLVTDKNKKLLGVVSGKKIQKIKDKNNPISEIIDITYPMVNCQDSIVQILQVLDDNNISMIPVIDDNSIVQGILTKSSLVSTLSQQYIETTEEVV